jgi:protoheme IX farnesyltransferase
MEVLEKQNQTTTAAMSAYWTLLKPRLSLLVVISTLLSFAYATDEKIYFNSLILLGLFGFLVTGAANACNQIIEIDLDAKMNRTRLRPMPTQTISQLDAVVFSCILLVVGICGIGWFFNISAAMLSFISFALYVFIYTPLKPKTPLSVLIGAFPGALPVLVGCVAASGNLYPDYFILFGIQFFWQFPHFWAIAWVLDDDYQRAGFRLLPFGRDKDSTAAYYIFIYTVALVMVSLFPSFLQLVGGWYTVITAIVGMGFLLTTIFHMRQLSIVSARRVMFYSFFYLPIVQLLLALDKI